MNPSQTNRADSMGVSEAPPPNAAAVCAKFDLSADAQGLLTSEATPAELLHELIERRLYDDAIRLLAYGLEPARAIWWGTLCAWHVLRVEDEPRSADLAALQAVVHWLQDPSDDNRYAAKRAKQQAGPGSLAGSLAQAVFYSGGTISYPGLPEVQPGEAALGGLISTGLLNSIKTARSIEPQRARQFLHFGIEVAQGANSWHRDSVAS